VEPELIIFILVMSMAGAGIGTFSGLVPGIHVNTLAALMLSFYPAIQSGLSSFFPAHHVPILVASCIISAAVVHSFVTFVPSVFLGAPDPDEVMNILPGHRLLLEGRGMAAVRASAIGSAIGTIAAVCLAVPMQFLVANGLGDYLESVTAVVLMIAVAALILRERGTRMVWAAVLIALSGMLGYACMFIIPEPAGIVPGGTLLFPLLTGLFGIPALILTPKNSSIPEQRDDRRSITADIPGLRGVVAGAVAGWFPGMTATSAAALCGHSSDNRPENFIAFVSSISSAAAVFAVVTISMTGKARSGTMMVVGDILGGSMDGVGNNIFVLMLLCILSAALIGYFVTIYSGKWMSGAISNVKMGSFSRVVITAMIILVTLMTGWIGLFVLATSTLLGLVPTSANVSRVHLSGCLIIPVILLRLGF